MVFHNTAREADAKLAELTVEAGRGGCSQAPPSSLSRWSGAWSRQRARDSSVRRSVATAGSPRTGSSRPGPARRITQITPEDLDTSTGTGEEGVLGEHQQADPRGLRRVVGTAVHVCALALVQDRLRNELAAEGFVFSASPDAPSTGGRPTLTPRSGAYALFSGGVAPRRPGNLRRVDPSTPASGGMAGAPRCR
ncbi:MAG TPA: hypothetical protein VGR26_05865 [Acidimicrobiales bacterium]|nr:hypothetical protein [Acidimicrobiales bacterium]